MIAINNSYFLPHPPGPGALAEGPSPPGPPGDRVIVMPPTVLLL